MRLEEKQIYFVMAGWQPICTDLHRNHPIINKMCTISDTTVFSRINQGEKYVIYECPMGLVDCATPIMIANEHVGTIFTGQFLFKTPNKDFFMKQAIHYGIDPDIYWNEAKQLPVFTRAQAIRNLEFLCELAEFTGRLGKTNIENIQKSIQLQDKELIFSKLFHQTPIPTVISDFDFNWILVNPAFEKFSGYCIDDISAASDRDELFPYPEDLELIHNLRHLVKKEPRQAKDLFINHFPIRAHFQNKMKTISEVQIDGLVIDEKSYFLIFDNITEKLRLEKQTLRNQKMDSLSIISGGIAHDFNNILTEIMGNINLLQLEEDKSSETQIILSDLQKAVQRAAKISNQLLTFSKGGMPQKKPELMSSILKDAISFAMRGSNIAFKITHDGEEFPVNVDRGQISQVINNLVINGLQAMPEGGTISGSLELQKKSNTNKEDIFSINQSTSQFTHLMKLSISDTGHGIPKEKFSNIFLPMWVNTLLHYEIQRKRFGFGDGLLDNSKTWRNNGFHFRRRYRNHFQYLLTHIGRKIEITQY